MRKTFKELEIGEAFVWAGWECVKQSKQTARLIKPNRVFYFHPNDPVNRTSVTT